MARINNPRKPAENFSLPLNNACFFSDGRCTIFGDVNGTSVELEPSEIQRILAAAIHAGMLSVSARQPPVVMDERKPKRGAR